MAMRDAYPSDRCATKLDLRSLPYSLKHKLAEPSPELDRQLSDFVIGYWSGIDEGTPEPPPFSTPLFDAALAAQFTPISSGTYALSCAGLCSGLFTKKTPPFVYLEKYLFSKKNRNHTTYFWILLQGAIWLQVPQQAQ